MLICLCFTYGCFHAVIAKVNSCDRDHIASQTENIYYLSPYRKRLLTCDVNNHVICKWRQFCFFFHCLCAFDILFFFTALSKKAKNNAETVILPSL